MRDKIFEYSLEDGNTIRITGDEIISKYYPYWSDRMDYKLGVGRDRTKDIQRCIDDFCQTYWATEIYETNP